METILFILYEKMTKINYIGGVIGVVFLYVTFTIDASNFYADMAYPILSGVGIGIFLSPFLDAILER